MYNKFIGVGNLTKDVDLRFLPSGTAVANFRLAITTKYKSGEEIKDDTLFIDIAVFGRQAEVCGQYLSKGGQCLVEGRLKEQSWEKDGQRHSKTQVIADNVRFLTKKEGAVADPGSATSEPEPF